MKHRSLWTGLAVAAWCWVVGAGPASAAVTWTDAAFSAQSGLFNVWFRAVPSATGQDTVVGLSPSAATDYTGLAAIVRFNSSGQIDVRNGGTYSAAVPVNYAANTIYLFRLLVNIPAHVYNVYVTPVGQAEIPLALNYGFRTEQAGASSLGFLGEAASGGHVALRGLTVKPVVLTSKKCPFAAAAAAAGLDDGCGGAGKGVPAYPTLLVNYGSQRPAFDVAGVDYPVGVPPGTLLDPSTVSLPAGCGYANNVVTCTQSNVTISGFDFSLHGEIQLVVTGGVSSITITGNKFSLGTGCNDPVVNIAAGGSVLFSHNTMDGEGPLCAGSITWGAMVNGVYAANAVLTLEYNLFYNTPQDVTDNRGPNSGAASIVERYNLFYLQGFTGHPDGIQLNGGNFNPIDVSFNTYYNSSPPNTVAGTQPFHIEAQLTAAISNSTVSYNTIVTPGSCNGGQNWPNGCTVNYDIACKSDGTGDSNVNFIGFGNYIDWSGAITPLDNEGCGTGATWGAPAQNIDLNTGTPITP